MSELVDPTVVHDLVNSFRAALFDQIGRFRQKRGSLNQVPIFVEAVQSELARYENKITALRAANTRSWAGGRPYDENWRRDKYSHIKELLDLVETKIRHIAKVSIDRARVSGTVEFSEQI
jgi:hypothetical protein